MVPRIYHVGLSIRGRTAIFQYRENVDCLDCEIYKYYGQRYTTKKQAKRMLHLNRLTTLWQLQDEYPDKRIKYVRID